MDEMLRLDEPLGRSLAAWCGDGRAVLPKLTELAKGNRPSPLAS